jgi:hypothetical protein
MILLTDPGTDTALILTDRKSPLPADTKDNMAESENQSVDWHRVVPINVVWEDEIWLIPLPNNVTTLAPEVWNEAVGKPALNVSANRTAIGDETSKLNKQVTDPELTPTLTTKDCLPLNPWPNGLPLGTLQMTLLCDTHREASQAEAAEKTPSTPDRPNRARWLWPFTLKSLPTIVEEMLPVAGALVKLQEDKVGVLKLNTRVKDPELTPTLTTKDCLPLNPWPNGLPLGTLQMTLLCDTHREASQAEASEKTPSTPDRPISTFELASWALKPVPEIRIDAIPVDGWFLVNPESIIGTLANERVFGNDVVGL